MDERDQYGDKFTEAVKEQLKEWGVKTVKNIELMDVRDSGGQLLSLIQWRLNNQK